MQQRRKLQILRLLFRLIGSLQKLIYQPQLSVGNVDICQEAIAVGSREFGKYQIDIVGFVSREAVPRRT